MTVDQIRNSDPTGASRNCLISPLETSPQMRCNSSGVFKMQSVTWKTAVMVTHHANMARQSDRTYHILDDSLDAEQPGITVHLRERLL